MLIIFKINFSSIVKLSLLPNKNIILGIIAGFGSILAELVQIYFKMSITFMKEKMLNTYNK